MEADTAGEQEEDEDVAASAAAAKGWKGKGKQRAGSVRRDGVKTGGSQVSRAPLECVENRLGEVLRCVLHLLKL